MTHPQQDQLALEQALDIGYRHFDTAYKYENEEIVGNAINKWLKDGKGQREDLFIVTKVWNSLRSLYTFFKNLQDLLLRIKLFCNSFPGLGWVLKG